MPAVCTAATATIHRHVSLVGDQGASSMTSVMPWRSQTSRADCFHLGPSGFQYDFALGRLRRQHALMSAPLRSSEAGRQLYAAS